MNARLYSTNEGWWGGCCNLATIIFGMLVTAIKGVRHPVDNGQVVNINNKFTNERLLPYCGHVKSVAVMPDNRPTSGLNLGGGSGK